MELLTSNKQPVTSNWFLCNLDTRICILTFVILYTL